MIDVTLHVLKVAVCGLITNQDTMDWMRETAFKFLYVSLDQARRMIIVRQKVSRRPRSVGKQLSLFEEDYEINGYRYTC